MRRRFSSRARPRVMSTYSDFPSSAATSSSRPQKSSRSCRRARRSLPVPSSSLGASPLACSSARRTSTATDLSVGLPFPLLAGPLLASAGRASRKRFSRTATTSVSLCRTASARSSTRSSRKNRDRSARSQCSFLVERTMPHFPVRSSETRSRAREPATGSRRAGSCAASRASRRPSFSCPVSFLFTWRALSSQPVQPCRCSQGPCTATQAAGARKFER